MHGILVCERTLELSDLDAEEVKFLPFTPPVDHTDGEAVILTRDVFVEGVTIDLHLELIGKVFRRMSVNRDTGQAKVERIAFCVLLIAGLILQHTVSAQLHIAKPLFLLGTGRRRKHGDCHQSH